jgi:holin-like protein
MRVIDLRSLLQIGALVVLWFAGDLLVRATGLPFPASVAGFTLLLLLLAAGVLPLPLIRSGADWLLARMLVLFVPALLAVLEYPQFIGLTGLKILAVIVASTAMVMAVTASVVCVVQRQSRDDAVR